MKPKHLLAALTAGALALLASCGANDAQAPAASADQLRATLTGDNAAREDMIRLYTEARAAGEPGPTIYIASVPEEFKPLTDAFAAAFPGLRADYQRYIGDRLATRLEGEYASGNHAGDGLLISVTELRRLDSLGWLSHFAPANVDQLDAQYRGPDGAFYAVYKKTFGVAYNTNLVSPDRVPQTVADVVAPEWRGRYTFPSGGAVTGTGNGPISILYERGLVSDAQVRALYEFGTGGPPSSELIPNVAQGRYAFAIFVNTAATNAQAARGAPLAVSFPHDLSVHTNVAAGILSRAPHPISSQLYFTWLLTPQAQQILADLEYYGTTTGAPTPRGYPPLSSFINAGIPEDEAWAARLAAFDQHRRSLTN